MSVNTHEIVIIDKVKSLSECLADACALGALAHGSTDVVVIEYNGYLSDALDDAITNICSARSALAEKLS